ncbi:hypothetical protein GCM10010495_07950 [Kitasatospora herbaricolor]|nr:hypothetical protein GCM10010495_07950 [Kitasatospora herbaricolor]
MRDDRDGGAGGPGREVRDGGGLRGPGGLRGGPVAATEGRPVVGGGEAVRDDRDGGAGGPGREVRDGGGLRGPGGLRGGPGDRRRREGRRSIAPARSRPGTTGSVTSPDR